MLRPRWNRFWKDKDGQVVIWQTPNVWLWAWFVSSLLARFIHTGVPHDVFRYAALVTLVVWALRELLGGVNYFRRLIGLLILAASLYNHFH